MTPKTLTSEQVLRRLESRKSAYQENYFAMYSSWIGGITLDPHLMLLPVDDHMVHRGDGIFEAIKAKGRKIYLLDAHLERLERSAEAISLELPIGIKDIRLRIHDTLLAADKPDVLIRLFVSRGPGSFTTNPYESIGAQIYIIVTRLNEPAAELYENGARGGYSQVLSKEAPWASIKSCNYLPNVLMKKEAVDRKLHFTICLDESQNLGEGSTENIAIVDQENCLVYPPFDRTLKGTTLRRVVTLAEELKKRGVIKDIKQGSIIKTDQKKWKEFFCVGTTLDVLPISELEGDKIGDGQPGPVARKLRELLQKDMQASSEVTDAF